MGILDEKFITKVSVKPLKYFFWNTFIFNRNLDNET